MSTGADGNIRSVLSRICASSSPAGRSKLMPRFMLKVWSVSSWLVSRSKTESRLCTFRLKRSGGSGDAAGARHEAAAVEEHDALQDVREGAGVLHDRAVGRAVGEDRARGVVHARRVHERTARRS